MDKGTVYFIDDERPVLNALRRALRAPMKGWDVRFEQSPIQALEEMQQDLPWVIIVDRKMPEMDGSDFLRMVQQKYPDAIRVLLTGDTSYKTAAEVAPFCHFLLAKPFEIDDIIDVVDRAVCLRKFELSDEARQAIGSIQTLPVLPSIYLQLVDYLNSEKEPETKTVAELISQDMSIHSKIIQTANSSFFGTAAAVFSAHNAVVRLGFNLVTKLVFCFQIHASAQDEEVHKKLVQQAELVARKCAHLTNLAQSNSKSIERSYFTGLVHNIGELVGNHYELNISTDLIGAFLLKLWGFDQALVVALLNQNNPEQCSGDDPVAVHLCIAKQLVAASQNSQDEACVWESLSDEIIEKANLRDYVGERNEKV